MQQKTKPTNSSLVERLIYGPQPELSETSGVDAMNAAKQMKLTRF